MKALPDGVTGPVQGEQVEPAIIHVGDCLEILRTLPDCSVDSIVTDPPYGLGKEPDALAMLADWLATGHHDVKGSGFMGKAWDAFVPQPALWRECLRVLKPGGHLLAFAGTRTHDLMALGLRIAGFEIRDTIMWVYGSGFPKSLDVSKAIDKAAGAERDVVGRHAYGESTVAIAGPSGVCANCGRHRGGQPGNCQCDKHGAPVTDAARRWEGWGTALKPALEPITMARKPMAGTVAANVLAHGTGALNIDGCRVATDWSDRPESWKRSGHSAKPESEKIAAPPGVGINCHASGRWPANLIHDGSDEVVALFPESKGQQGDVRGTEASRTGGEGTNCYGEYGRVASAKRGDTGSAARFFYCAKASKRDRDEGLDEIEAKACGLRDSCRFNSGGRALVNGEWVETGSEPRPKRNIHPTVKPTALMRYLCRLVTPPGGLVLDPFMGSGSTGKAAMLEGFRFIGCELDPDYAVIARARIEAASAAAEAEADDPSQERLFA